MLASLETMPPVSLPTRFLERPAVTHWDHNGHYHGFLMQQLPARPARGLDVGCGTGTFARHFAQRAHAVDAIDISPEMIAVAHTRHQTVRNVRWLVGNVLTTPLDLDGYDTVTAIASLHHLPLDTGLSRLGELMRPGGTLAVLGLAAPSAVDYALGVAAVPPTLPSVSRRPWAGAAASRTTAAWSPARRSRCRCATPTRHWRRSPPRLSAGCPERGCVDISSTGTASSGAAPLDEGQRRKLGQGLSGHTIDPSRTCSWRCAATVFASSELVTT